MNPYRRELEALKGAVEFTRQLLKVCTPAEREELFNMPKDEFYKLALKEAQAFHLGPLR